PLLSDDALRYRHDGRMWLSGQSPYAQRPSEFDPALRDSIDRVLPYPDFHTIYLPTSQLVFVTTRAMEDRLPTQPRINQSWRDGAAALPWAHQLLIWRIVMAGFLVGGTWFLINTLILIGRSPWWAPIFAWHPLTTIEIGAMAHQDVIGVSLLLATIYAFTFARTRATRSFSAARSAGVLLGLAVGVKPLAILVAPFWLIRYGGRGWLGPLIVTLLLLASVFLFQNGYAGFGETLANYTQKWEANGSLFHVLRTQVTAYWKGGYNFGPQEIARGVGVTVVAMMALVLVNVRARWESALYTLLTLGLLVAPVVYPWYLLWPLAIVPLLARGGLTILVFASTSTLSYHLWRTPDWIMPWPWLAAEYGPVYAALLWETILELRGLKCESPIVANRQR
ncbi:MAG TPA: hypothetical protein VGB55_03265, partial [Tepidisphaeraceae bacterium]